MGMKSNYAVGQSVVCPVSGGMLSGKASELETGTIMPRCRGGRWSEAGDTEQSAWINTEPAPTRDRYGIYYVKLSNGRVVLAHESELCPA